MIVLVSLHIDKVLFCTTLLFGCMQILNACVVTFSVITVALYMLACDPSGGSPNLVSCVCNTQEFLGRFFFCFILGICYSAKLVMYGQLCFIFRPKLWVLKCRSVFITWIW